MRPFIPFVFLALGVTLHTASATPSQGDSVDVIFRYTPAGSPSLVHLAAEFNNWANNSSGTITPNPLWTMTKSPSGVWEKTVRLRIGGGSGPGGTYEYKFNENGSANGWLPDPLNPRTAGSYGNSIIAVQKPTILHLQPVPNMVISEAQPVIRADIFAATGGSIDAAASRVVARGVDVGGIGGGYDPATRSMQVTLPPMTDGPCTVVIEAHDAEGSVTRDSTTFIIRAAPLQWLTRDNPRQPDSTITVAGMVAGGVVTDISIDQNGHITLTPVMNGQQFTTTAALSAGRNTFVATGLSGSQRIWSDTLSVFHPVDARPRPVIMLSSTGGSIELNAFASSDPDGDPLTFTWRSEDERNPSPLGIDQGGPTISFPRPATHGEYFLSLEARDPSGNTGRVRNYVTIASDTITLGAVQGNPGWVRDAVVYEIFVPSFSSTRNLAGITASLPMIRSLGVNTLWLMPIFDNRGTINEFNGGYDIVDFFSVEPELGTLRDFRTLVDSCHASGMHVILDITPNHVSDQHPWVNDIRQWGAYSIFRPFIETRVLGNDRGLGQSVVQYGGAPLYARYSNWGLANLNLSNSATRDAMMDVFHFWVDSMRADGFRMDVYWGPQNRYGQDAFWKPFREDIKRSKPEIFVLGETDGTGPGSELNFADTGGGCDAAYDWNLFGQIRTTLSGGDVNNLHNRISNFSTGDDYNHWTGPNAHYLRFMENHDEDRIAQMFASNLERTKPGAALLLTTPGIPMIYAGQEVGWKGRRDPIDFSTPNAAVLRPYYTRLIDIRRRFAALRTPNLRRLASGTSATYTFLRPYRDQNIVVLISFNSAVGNVDLRMDKAEFALSTPLTPGVTVYLNDVLNDVAFPVALDGGTGRVDVSLQLAPFQSRVLVLADTAMFPVSAVELPADIPGFSLSPNHPNPVGVSGTRIDYSIPGGPDGWHVELAVFDQLGRRVAMLVDEAQSPGAHSAWLSPAAAAALSQGMYLYRLRIIDRAGVVRTLSGRTLVQR